MMDMTPFDPASAFKWLGAIVVGAGAWVWNKMDSRVTRLEEQSAQLATKEDVSRVAERVDRVLELLVRE